jgi:hypothetical protein
LDTFKIAVIDCNTVSTLLESRFTRIKQDYFTVVVYVFITSSETSGQPWFATVPLTCGHLSSLSNTPSPSVSGQGQPAFSLGPATVGHLSFYQLHLSISIRTTFETGPASLGHSSSLSAIPSPSVSGHPFNAAKPATSGQESALSCPSPSVSGHPLNSFKPATSGQASSLSNIPSPSVSLPPED